MNTNLIDGVIFGIIISVIILGLRTLMVSSILFELLIVLGLGLLLGSAQYALDRFRQRRKRPAPPAAPPEKQMTTPSIPPLQSPDIGWDNDQSGEEVKRDS